MTLGVLPTWLHTNDQHEITRIIAPDLLHNPYFGVGGHFRVFEYPSTDEQWSVAAGIKQRVERTLRLRVREGEAAGQQLVAQLQSDFRSQRRAALYGIGNSSLSGDVTNYTASQVLGQVQTGFNLNHTWQLQYTFRARRMEVTAGTLAKVPTIESRYPQAHGLGVTNEVLNQLALVYDTRDDATIPSRGSQCWRTWVSTGTTPRSAIPSIRWPAWTRARLCRFRCYPAPYLQRTWQSVICPAATRFPSST
ncbi:MAG: BamA/TamA family outer membrane protein [Steroidobacteraceae bacterium]